jgi:hypothetical protein
MKKAESNQNAEKTPRRAGSADFLFVGTGVAPLALMLGDQPALAFLVLVPLLFAACLCGAWEQAGSDTGLSAGDPGSSGLKPVGIVTLRDRLKR